MAAGFSFPDVQTPERAQAERFKPVQGPAVWHADEIHPAQWTYILSSRDIDEMEIAVREAEKTGKEIQHITLEDVSLPTLGPRLTAFRDEVVHGRGFQLIKGVPVHRWSRKQTVTAYWILGLHWGKASSNNHKGHLVGHIKDLGLNLPKDQIRLYATNTDLPFHNDICDVVSLLCLNGAKVGGDSRWVSSWSIHNEFLRQRPDLGPLMTQEWYMDRKGEVPKGKKPYYAIPPFNYFKGNLSVTWSSSYYLSAQRHGETPRLTPQHMEAIELFERIAASPRFSVRHRLQPGDIQLLSNHKVLHARDEFMDDSLVPEKKRHMLRLWLAPPNGPPLPESYRDILGGSVEIGNRGGIKLENTKVCITLEAE